MLREPKRAQTLRQQRDEFDLSFRAGLTEEVGVELEEGTLASLLGAFVAVKFGNAEPLDRALEGVGLGADQTAHGGRHLGTKRDLATALVRETEKLRLDLVTRLGFIKLERLEHGRVVFREAERGGGLTPEAEDVISACERFGIEFAEAGQ